MNYKEIDKGYKIPTMKTRSIFLSLLMTCVMMSQDVMAQVVDLDTEMSDAEFDRMSFNDFKKRAKSDFESFRKKCIEDYNAFLRNPWHEFEQQKPKPKPVIEETPPVVIPEEDKTKPVIEDEKPHIEDKKTPIEEVIPQPKPTPQPKPVLPVTPQPIPKPTAPVVAFKFYGTTCNIPFNTTVIPHINQVNENAVADAIDKISKYSDFENTLAACLKLRKDMQLSDWAYLQMLEAFATQSCGGYNNSAVLLQGLLYALSGYRMRFGADSSHLYLFYASQHEIYKVSYYKIDGDNYYPYKLTPSQSAYISRAAMPNEQALSLYITGAQRFEFDPTSKRQIVSRDYKGFSLPVSVSKNDIAFYNTYPSSEVGGNFMTRWAMYANTPLHPDVRLQILASLQPQLKGMSKKEAAERLLNLVQTGLVYEYDDKVWGGDRAFFAEESLYYPYCDCEDRSILFTRLVRELLGLKCMLIYYPGHLASAVCFDEPVSGDYIEYNGKRFVVCDATYIGAPVGRTMPDMDNKSAKVIVL